MLIDLILDRTYGTAYNARNFYMDCMAYGMDDVTKAMDYGTEDNVRKALRDYITRNDYNPDICEYIDRVYWLTDREPDGDLDAFIGRINSAETFTQIGTALDEAKYVLDFQPWYELYAIAKINMQVHGR